MRNCFKFFATFLEAWKQIPDKEMRLTYYEAILELGINDIQPNEEDPILQALLIAPTLVINKAHWISDIRSEAWKLWWEAKSKAKKGNQNAKKDRTKTKKKTEKNVEVKKSKLQQKRDENIELIETIQSKVESLWLVYRSWEKERINATNLRTSKQFKATAEKFWLSTTQLALAVIEASMNDKFRSWKIFNCETIYYNYARIINQAKANNQKFSNSITSLPWA